MINCDLPNDDLDLQAAWLDVVEKKGEHFTSRDLLKRFVECCDYSPGEYAVMRKNYQRGIYPPLSGLFWPPWKVKPSSKMMCVPLSIKPSTCCAMIPKCIGWSAGFATYATSTMT